MMFAHAEFEREVRSLVDATNPKEPGFGERHDNQWTASESGTAKIIVLIMRHCGSGRPQIDQIRNLLDDAVDLWRERNFLAHGTWWCFRRRTLTVEVRGGVRWERPELPPENHDIGCLTSRSSLISSKILRLSYIGFVVRLSQKSTEAEIRAASSFLRAP